MKHEMQIELSSADGALLRTVGLVERRGFRVRACCLHESQDDRCLLEMQVESERPVEVLKRQIERLHDVQWVELQAAAMPAVSIRRRSSASSPKREQSLSLREPPI